MISKKMLIFSNLVIVVIMLVISSFIYFSLNNKIDSILSSNLDNFEIYNINEVEDVDKMTDKNKSYEEMIKEENYPSNEQVQIDVFKRIYIPSQYEWDENTFKVQYRFKYKDKEDMLFYDLGYIGSNGKPFFAIYKLLNVNVDGKTIYKWQMIRLTTQIDYID